MKILLDECVPAKLRTQLPQEHDVTTVPRMGWSGTKNGVLLEMADQQFDVFITADKQVYKQQNLSGLRVAVLVIPTNNSRIVQQIKGSTMGSSGETAFAPTGRRSRACRTRLVSLAARYASARSRVRHTSCAPLARHPRPAPRRLSSHRARQPSLPRDSVRAHCEHPQHAQLIAKFTR
jgi:predicted nuclease of predicted toxin-antitoxin system